MCTNTMRAPCVRIDVTVCVCVCVQVVFPPIVEQKEDVWSTRGQSHTNTALRTRATLNKDTELSHTLSTVHVPGTLAQENSVLSTGAHHDTSKARFLTWLENTFQQSDMEQTGAGGQGQRDDSPRKTYRKVRTHTHTHKHTHEQTPTHRHTLRLPHNRTQNMHARMLVCLSLMVLCLRVCVCV